MPAAVPESQFVHSSPCAATGLFCKQAPARHGNSLFDWNGSREMPDVLNGVEEFCRALGVATQPALEVRLVAEEVLTNFVKHAHALPRNLWSSCGCPPPPNPYDWNSAMRAGFQSARHAPARLDAPARETGNRRARYSPGEVPDG